MIMINHERCRNQLKCIGEAMKSGLTTCKSCKNLFSSSAFNVYPRIGYNKSIIDWVFANSFHRMLSTYSNTIRCIRISSAYFDDYFWHLLVTLLVNLFTRIDCLYFTVHCDTNRSENGFLLIKFTIWFFDSQIDDQ